METFFRLLFPRGPTARLVFVTILFGVAPTVTNAFVAYMVFFDEPERWAQTASDCNLVALTSFGVACVAMIGYTFHGFGPRKSLLAVFLHSGIMIVVFAGIYRGHGMTGADSDGPTALYFSIITWTTLGYGDITPKHDIRLIAAAEALIGNLSLGLLVGLITHFLSRRRPFLPRRRL